MKYTVDVEYTIKGKVEVYADSPEHAKRIIDNQMTDNNGQKFSSLGVMLKTVCEMIRDNNYKL